MKPFFRLLLLFLLSLGTARAAPDILIEGWDGTFWQNIDDADLNPNQAVTDFDRVNLGFFRERRYRVRNRDNNDTLTVSSTASNSGHFTIAGLPNGTNIPGNGNNEFTIRFAPTSRGPKEATITIRSNASGAADPYTFAVEGIGEGPEIRVSGSDDGTDPYFDIADGETTPSASQGTSFGIIAAGASRDRFFRIKNEGDSNLTYDTPTLSGANPGSFEVRSLPIGDRSIGAGNDHEFEIRFQPTTAGVKTATVTIRSNDQDEDPYTYSITGTATGEPNITVQGREAGVWNNINDNDLNPDQSVTNFGNVDVGTSAIRNFRVKNDGNDTLTITSASSSSGQFSVARLDAGTNVAPGADSEFVISFVPTADGVRNSTITIVSNSPGAEATYTFVITAVGRAPEITMSGSDDGTDPYVEIADGDTTPSVATGTDFGTVAVGNNRDRFFRIKNDGNTGLDYVVPTITGPDAAHFDIRSLSTIDTVIASGNDREFEIRFRPTTGGVKNATFRMESNDPDESPYTFALTGTATVTPDIRVRGLTSLSVPFDVDDGDLNPDQDVTNFGRADLGLTGTLNYRIVNEGTGRLNISSVTSSHPAVTFTMPPAFVEPGETGIIVFQFTPTTRSTVNATITINSNDPDTENPYTFALTGIGEGPEIVVEGPGTDGVFRNIADGSTTPSANNGTVFPDMNAAAGALTRTFRIRNTGDKSLSLYGRSFSGPAAGDYDVGDLLILGTRIINAGNTIEFTITFNPTTSGARNAVLSIGTTDRDEDPFDFAITGTGVGDPEIKIQGNRDLEPRVEIMDGDNTPRASGGTLFADTDAGKDRTHHYRITNEGSGRLTLGVPTLTGDNPGAFSILGYSNAALEPGEQEDFDIRFHPTSFGVKTAVFTLANNDANEDPYTFRLEGTAHGSEISIEGGTNFAEEILDGDTTPREADGTDFGFAAVSNQAVVRTFRVRNSGDNNLKKVSVSSNNAAFIITDQPSDEVTFNNPSNFSVSFDPSAAGAVNATITVESDDPNESVFTFRVTGFGTSATTAMTVTGGNSAPFVNGQATISGAQGTDFGSVNVTGGTAARVFHVENTGSGVLQLTGVTSNSALFTVGTVNTAPVNPGDSVDFTVTFDPTSTVASNAVITINGNASASPTFTFSVGGTGTSTPPPAAPEISVFGGEDLDVAINSGDTTPRRADGTDFQQAEAGVDAVRTFRIRNTGTAALNLTGVTANPGAATRFTSFPSSIPAGGDDDFTIVINRQNPGVATVVITIASNDSDESSYTFTVTLEALAPSGVLAVTDFTVTGTDISLTWTSAAGRAYRVVSAPDTAGPWTAVPGFTGLPGDSIPQTTVLPDAVDPATAPRLFFRLEEE